MKQSNGAEQKREKLRRYRPPAIVSRESLEVIAAVCSPGKGLGQPGDCFINSNS